MRIRLFGFGLFISIALLAAGCGQGPATAPVFGKVSWKGQPIAQGFITFQGTNGPAVMDTIKDGKYRLAGNKSVPVGSVRITIEGYEEDGTEVMIAPGQKQKGVKQVVPAKYNSKSTLQVDVAAGKDNEHNFDLMP